MSLWAVNHLRTGLVASPGELNSFHKLDKLIKDKNVFLLSTDPYNRSVLLRCLSSPVVCRFKSNYVKYSVIKNDLHEHEFGNSAWVRCRLSSSVTRVRVHSPPERARCLTGCVVSPEVDTAFAPSRILTHDLLIASPTLYPLHHNILTDYSQWFCLVFFDLLVLQPWKPCVCAAAYILSWRKYTLSHSCGWCNRSTWVLSTS